MTIELAIALISAVVAVISACIAVFGQIKLARMKGEQEEARDQREHEKQAVQLFSRYREPLRGQLLNCRASFTTF